MQKKYGYYHGRFQPFHNGHMNMIKLMLDKHDEVIIGLSNPFRAPAISDDQALAKALATEDTRSPLNNPWPYWQRVLMIRWTLKDAGLDVGRVIFVPNLKASGFDTEETEFLKSETVKYTMPSGRHNKLILENNKKEGWDIVVIDPKDRPTSGTKIRQMIKSGDLEWKSHVPAGTERVIEKYGFKIKP